jgi:hypothetical protein
VVLQFQIGWYQEESLPDNPSKRWRWTERHAQATFRNPLANVVLYLEYDGQRDVFGTNPQIVTVYASDHAIGTFPVTSTAPTLRKLAISAAQLGAGESAEVRIEVDRTFVPADTPQGGTDRRELGIRVYHMVVEPE